MTIERRGSTVLETLREVAERWNLQLLDEDIHRLTSDHSVQVGFLGDFSSGKSTLINELTGVEDLMPTHLEPCTANAGQVVSTPDLEAPEYFRVDPNGEMTSISQVDFDDLACGRADGRPLVHLPSRSGFPAGFIFLDTPGLSTLIEEHTEVTLGELPFVDAAVICVDIRKGGLTSSVTEFLKFPGIRHLQHRFLIALTFADQLSATSRQEVAEKVANTLWLWCMNWRFFRMGRLNKDRLLSRLGMTFLRKNLCLLFQGTCFGQPIVLPPFRQAPSPISPSLSSRVSGA